MNEAFPEAIIQCDVTRCVIFISNKVEYLDKEHSYKNSTKEVTVKSGALFPPILQHCCQYCNVHALVAPSKLQSIITMQSSKYT